MVETRTVTLGADGIQEREVAYVRYELYQQIDVEGQPTGRTRGGKITVRVKSRNDGNTEILEWMCDTYMSKNGYISFPDKDGGEMKRLNFKDARVVQYTETYDDKSDNRQIEEFTISAKEIQVGNAIHVNSWTLGNSN
jgi:hypothetical protein